MHLIKQNKTSGFHEWRPSELRHYTDFAAKYNGHFEKNLRGHRSGSHSLLVVGIFHPAYLMEGSSCLHSALQSENPGVSYNSSVHSEAWWGAAQRFHTTAPVGLLPWTSLPRRCESGLKKWGYPSGSLTQRFSNSHWFKMLFFPNLNCLSQRSAVSFTSFTPKFTSIPLFRPPSHRRPHSPLCTSHPRGVTDPSELCGGSSRGRAR